MALEPDVLDAELRGLDRLELAEPVARRVSRQVAERVLPKVAAVGLALALWQLVSMSGWRPDYVLPGPGPVLAELGRLSTEAEFWSAVATTMRRALSGYAIAVAVGTVVGGAVARVTWLRRGVGALITGLQTMPSIAWFPLAILLFSLSEGAIAFVVVLGAAPAVATGLIAGVDHVPPLLLRAGRVLGADGLAMLRHVVLPAALPSFVAGLKQGWAFAWRSLMAAELLVVLADRPSIGARLQFARELSDVPALLAFMIVVLLVGIVADGVFGAADAALRRRRGLIDAGA